MAQNVNKQDFEDFFPTLIEDLSEHVKQYDLPSNALEWFQNV